MTTIKLACGPNGFAYGIFPNFACDFCGSRHCADNIFVCCWMNAEIFFFE